MLSFKFIGLWPEFYILNSQQKTFKDEGALIRVIRRYTTTLTTAIHCLSHCPFKNK